MDFLSFILKGAVLIILAPFLIPLAGIMYWGYPIYDRQPWYKQIIFAPVVLPLQLLLLLFWGLFED